MKQKPKKVLIIGLDAPIAYRVYQYAQQGHLQNIKRLIDGGVYAENYLVPYPTVTPENWTTIATGANIGTHGVTDFSVNVAGKDLDEAQSAWNPSLCEAEYLWDAAEKAGKKSIIINWPCIYPATVKEGYQLGGNGLAMNEWRTERGLLYRADLSDGQLFTTDDLPFAEKITLRKPSGWKGTRGSTPSLEAELKLKYSACMKAGRNGERLSRVKSPEIWSMLIQDTNGDGYNRVLLSRSKNVSEVFAVLSEGEWSKIVINEFQTLDGNKRGAFRCKLLNLSRDGSRVSLLVTPICSLDCYSYPGSLFGEVAKENPLAMPSHIFSDGLGWGWYDEKTFLELVDMEHQWFSDAATYLMRNREWALLMMHMHSPDWMYHYAVPPEKWNQSSIEYEGAEKARLYEEIELEVYNSIDKAIGRMLEAAGEDASVFIVSDHGSKPKARSFSPSEPLSKGGLLSFGSAAAGKSIDFSESKAIPANGPWIYVNLKGRYTHGIVDAEEYEEIQNRIIKALYEYTDPLTGMKPVALALKKEDARLLGLYGDRIGDVVYAVSEYYGGSHGQLPTAKYGVGSLRGLLIMAGDGLKKGCVLKRTIHATDIVPTICYLTGLPLPRNAEGGIIYQALQADATEHTETWKSEQKSDRPPDQPFGAFQVES